MKRTRRLIAGALALGALALATGVSALAAGPGPGACTNITSASVTYFDSTSEDTPNTVTGGAFTELPSCRSVVYTMHVYTYDATGVLTGVLTDSVRGAGDTFVGPFAVSNVTSEYICVEFTASRGPTTYEVASAGGVGCPTTSFDTSAPPAGIITPGNSGAGSNYG